MDDNREITAAVLGNTEEVSEEEYLRIGESCLEITIGELPINIA